MQRKNGLLAACLALLLVAPVLYVLSTGPAVWLASRGYISWNEGSPAFRIYLPIAWLMTRSPACTAVGDRWVDLWAGEPEDTETRAVESVPY
jgi:hypothetical protein